MDKMTLSLTIQIAIFSCVVQAQEFDINELNYGFATYLGTGIYTIQDRNVQVYKIPFSYEFDMEEGDKFLLTLRAPVTLGYYDFTSSDFVDSGLPDKASTFSFVPGIEALYPVKKNWYLGGFVDAGIARNLESDDSNTIYGAGFVSFYENKIRNSTLTLGNRLLYAKDRGSNISQADDFASFETVIDYRFPAKVTKNSYLIDFSLYYANYRYFDDLDFARPSQRPVEVVIQNEVGFTFGLNNPVKWKYLKIPRVGLGYRFGDDLSIFRIIIGSVF